MPIIETTGEAIVDESGFAPCERTTVDDGSKRPPPPTDLKDIPVYTVARAVEWMRDPKNAPKIERMAVQGGEAVKTIARGIDREVGKVGRLLAQLGTDDDVLEDFTNSFLKSVFGLGDD